ncbi:hypothetical protein HHI36_009276 [Cryptolaemus montrouzieri]|uniref:C2H2-type domain-containing protein n=1 Tax=Cryptolaemus montrouzieri TaxID=559131 RepID=A0ABD2MVC3_9CUCU
MMVDSAKCKECGKSFSRKGGGTTSLKLHLKSQRSDKYEELLLVEKGNQQNKPQTTKQLTLLQECEKQLTLKDSLKNKGVWNESNTKQKEIDKLVAESLQNLPFNFVEGVGFQRLVQAALPRYNLIADVLSACDEEDQNIGVDEDDTVHNKLTVKKELLNEYNREKRLTVSENPRLWWKMHTNYNSLSALVRQYLSPPPGSVPSEQFFSTAGL